MSDHTEEIRARVEAAMPQESLATERVGLIVTYAEANMLTTIWYDDGDVCAEVHDNLALGCDADALAQLFANAVDDIPYLLTELTALRQEVTRLTKALAAADAYFPATALEVVNLRQENTRLKDMIHYEQCDDADCERCKRMFEAARNVALSTSPAQEKK